jgi:hypothetical protein
MGVEVLVAVVREVGVQVIEVRYSRVRDMPEFLP